MDALKIKNKFIESLCSWLNELQLAGRESRERTRFIEICLPRINDIEKNKREIIGKYVEKDEKGQWKRRMVEGTEVWDIPDDKVGDFNKDYDDLMEEEFAIDVLEGNKAKLKTVKDLVLNTDFKFGPSENDSLLEKRVKIRQANDYVAWCEAFEKLKI